jgi:murein DD-endopeptidase MepM/ murein hydrolase activator NlpD
MRRNVSVAVALIVLAPLAPRVPAAQSSAAPLAVTVRGQPAQPGSILEIRVRAPEGTHDPRGTAFGRPLTFAPAGEPHTWRALVGVDVLQDAGPSRFSVGVTAPGGRTLVSEGTIVVAPRAFATRRLRVASQFVEPSAAEIARITAEAARLDDIFTTVTVPDHVGPFAAPIAGVPGSNFGTRSIFNGEPRAPHAGVDYRGAVGTRIAAPGAGRVVLAEPLFFTGDTVIIDHGLGLYSLLAHLARIDVSPGQNVERGATVGLLGATGRVTGPHLHWTVRLGNARVDPLRLLSLLAAAQSGDARTVPAVPGASGAVLAPSFG